jgi:2-keto-4-pentenoate hydratase/2-oxohepta-3-ene-1,7-dioic acid hydratase in catechol pathway
VRLAQYIDQGGVAQVGVVNGDMVTPVSIAPGSTRDETVIALAMGDVEPSSSGPETNLSNVTLLSPIGRPPSIRDFMLFEGHVANSLKKWKRDVPPQWYVEPSFYFSSPHSLSGSGATIAVPTTDIELDYELELGVVIGRELVDADPDAAAAAIAGFTLFNDFSLRDRQSRERPLGLGPSKSKDFASALGPVLVTPDEVPGSRRRPQLVLEAFVNGVRWSYGKTESMHFDLGEAIAHASAGAKVVPGDVIGSGTVTSGCVMELLAMDDANARWLRPGDLVELTSDVLGTLSSLLSSRN